MAPLLIAGFAGIAFLPDLGGVLAVAFRVLEGGQHLIGPLPIDAGQAVGAHSIEIALGQGIAAISEIEDSDAGMRQGRLGSLCLDL